MNESDIYEKRLIRRVQSGDKRAFEDLYRTYFEMLCNFIYRYTSSQAICEELVQDLFLDIWFRRSEWDPRVNVRSYLYKAARNRALDYLKHKEVERSYLEERKREKEREELDLSETDLILSCLKDERSKEQKLIQMLQVALDRLPERRKMIFTLSREEGLTYLEIADVLEISVKTVETQMGRSLKNLREILSEYMPLLLLLIPFV